MPIQEIELEGEMPKPSSGKAAKVSMLRVVPGMTVAAMTGRSRIAQARSSLVEASDGVIFVADTRRLQLDSNIDAMNDLMEHLRQHQLPSQLPTVIAYNRQDDPDALATRNSTPCSTTLTPHPSRPWRSTARASTPPG